MNIVPLTEDVYREWDEFCLSGDSAWFYHTTQYLAYTLNYMPQLKPVSLSFAITEDSRILAICPLLLETIKFGDEAVLEFSYSGSATWAPAFANGLSSRKREKLLNVTFSHIDQLALENGVVRASFKLSPLTPAYLNSKLPQNNYLVKYGYIDISLNTQIIYLRQGLEIIRHGVRKGHVYDINRGLKQLEVAVFDRDNITRGIFDQYRELHHKAAGRVTRPLITFDIMYDWILQGYAILVGASLNGKYIAFSLVETYKNAACYGSACNDPDYPDLPCGHVLQWKTIEWLKEHDFEYYETGLQQYNCLPHDYPSRDEINISFFKRGFGGFTAPYFTAEKYYSKDYYLKVNLDRVNRYASCLEAAADSQQNAGDD